MNTTETRALSSVLSAPTAFRSRVGAMVDHTASRHVERWAPEQGAARSGSLRSVAFADRIITPWFEAPQRLATLHAHSEMAAHGPASRAVEGTSWVFPRPWYQDELAWLAASRLAAAESTSPRAVLTTRGTYAAPAPAGLSGPASIFSARPSPSDAFASAASAASVYGGPMELVAPSLTASSPVRVAPSGGVVGRAAPAAMPAGLPGASLAAWSPIVPFAAAQAAQIVAGALDQAVRAGLGTSERSPILSALAYVAPAELGQATPSPATSSSPMGPTSPPARPLGGLASSAVQVQLASAVARIESVMASAAAPTGRSMEAPALVTPPAPRAPSATPAPSVAPTFVPPAATPAPRAAEGARPAVVAPAAPVAASDAASGDAPAASPPLAPSLPSPAAAPVDPSLEAVRQLIASSPDAAVALRTVELLTRGAATGGAMASSAGPRVVLPAGLGGIASAVQTAAMVNRPLAVSTFAATTAAPAVGPFAAGAPDAPDAAPSTAAQPALPFAARAAFAPVWAAAPGALSSIAAERPVAVGHVAWADRWLARMAGASPRGLAAFDPAGAERAEPRLMAAGAPEVVFLSPAFDPVLRAAARATEAAPSARPVVPSSVRVDDTQAVSDDVFAAIARARAGAGSQRRPTAATPPTAPSAPSPTAADVIATAPPTAPGAGFGASLAASPVAPALASLFPLPQVASFDPRALFGGATARAYASGLFQPMVQRLVAGAFGAEPAAALAPIGDDGAPVPAVAAGAPDVTYVTPGERVAERGVAEAFVPATAAIAAQAAQAAAAQAARADLVALHTTLLSSVAGDRRDPLPYEQSPMVVPTRAAWTPTPGTTAEMAHAMGVAQVRSSADLAFDFVGPELILAAQAYGFGPAEASQAARLAVSGPGGLSAMATAVDLTFLRALQERRDLGDAAARADEAARASAPATAPSAIASPAAAPSAPASPAAAPPSASAGASVAPVTAYPSPPSPGERSALFGVERRLPRGAFLWPAGVVTALGIDAATAEGTALPVAALELLAASAVADLGSWAVARGIATGTTTAGAGERAAEPVLGAPASPSSLPFAAPSAAPSMPGAADVAAEPAVRSLPAAQRSRFDAIYLALAQTSAGQSLSPSARAARALAVMARGDDGAPALSALERAASAWSALPVVMTGDLPGRTATGTTADAAASTDTRGGGLAALAARAGELLGSLVTPSAAEVFFGEEARSSGREAPAQTLVQPAPAPRATDAAQAGRGLGAFARHGGGEVEIPAWFEAAARKMFESGGGSSSEGISMAELTLIATAPASSVAAATRGSSPTPAAPAEGAAAGGAAQDNKLKPDIEQLAQDVYAEVVKMFEMMRARNGEP
jgi:hypothetical protein